LPHREIHGTSEQTRQKAERGFKQEERARDGRNTMMEYEAHARATREKTARLKALRLAKEAETKTVDPTGHPAKQTKRAPTARWKLSGL
jgi:hypothetical protein